MLRWSERTPWYNILCHLLGITLKTILRKKVIGQTELKNFFCSQKNIAIFQYDFRKLLGEKPISRMEIMEKTDFKQFFLFPK